MELAYDLERIKVECADFVRNTLYEALFHSSPLGTLSWFDITLTHEIIIFFFLALCLFFDVPLENRDIFKIYT